MQSILPRLCLLGALLALAACGGTLSQILPGGAPRDPVFHYEPADLDVAPSTGSAVSERIDAIEGEVRGHQRATVDYLLRYEALNNQSERTAREYSEIVSTLEAGATGDRAERGRALLAALDGQLDRYDRLSADVSGAAAEVAPIRTALWPLYEAEGIQRADNRRLEALEEETNRIVSVLERLTYRIAAEAAGQAAVLAEAREARPELARGLPARRRGPALVRIRFDGERPDYEEQLYQAVVVALQANPEARFDVVAVSPQGAGSTVDDSVQDGAEAVLRTLSEIGLPSDRTTLSAQADEIVAAGEVRVYVR